MAQANRQFVIALDLQLPVDETEVVAHLPADRREVRFFKLSESLTAEVLEAVRDRNEIDFDLVSQSANGVIRRARREAEGSSEPVHWFIWGRAPLPIFAQAGYELSAWGRPVTLLNRRKDGVWDEIRITEAAVAASEVSPYFDVVNGLDDRSEASGRVAVFVSVMGNAAPKEALRDYVEERGDGFAGTIEIRTSTESILDAQSAGRAANELASHMSRLAAAFPYALNRGIAVFIAGPAHLAFLAGRAVNRNIVAETSFPNFVAGTYVDAVSLPLREASAAPLDPCPEAVAARSRTRQIIREAFEDLRSELEMEHLPESPLADRRPRFIEGLRQIRWTDDVPDDGFALRVLNRELAVGDSLIEALRPLPDEQVRGVTCQLVVHELFHDFQALTRANYRQIGRAGVVLEEIDFWADIFAVQVLVARQADGGVSSLVAVQNEIDRVLLGIEVFDRGEQGRTLRRLYERRLRRYLIWYLQRARAATLREPRDTSALFAQRLVVELVPTAGYLDDRGDKVVRRATDRTQLVVLCDGQLERFPADEDLDPAKLVEDVRNFRGESLVQAMETVVGKRPKLLAPWAVL